MTRKTFAVALSVLAAVPFIVAFAGGWATITVENLPDYFVAQQPTNVTFSIRQHGMELIRDVTPTVEVRSGDAEVKARGVQTNRPGYYTATLNVPNPGKWTVTIQSGFGKSNLKLLPIAAVSSAGRTPVTLNENERGERLFVAKGCLSCHVHAQVAESGTYKVGPDLTNRGLDRKYLATFLADPSVKKSWTSEARMPDLDLKDNEIAALVTFLTTDQSQRQAKANN